MLKELFVTNHRARKPARFALMALLGLAAFTPGCAVVDAPFSVIDTVIDAPFAIAQSAVDVPLKPVTDPMREARVRKSNQKQTERRKRQMDAERERLIAEGKLPPPQIGADGKPIYTSENYLVAVSPIDSGSAAASTTTYKRGAAVSTDKTPVNRPLPPSMGMAIPVPRSKEERKRWQKEGAPSIVQNAAAVDGSMINIRKPNEVPTNAGPPGSGTVTYQPSISAPTHKPVYTGPGQEPRTDRGATR